ncbi:MAG: hypothetical protein H8E76_00915 [Helicobacteraceae bacterium]|nr:hypothetical protein [Candidatus Sulfurimonas ponti]
MKKSLFFSLLLIILAALSPIIGNKIVTYYVDQEIVAVKKKGITLNFKSETPGYMYTSKQYEFILTDVDAFARYLTEYGAGLLPPYTDELLKSIVFRLDMKYHNIPFLEPISIDIYPMYISDKIMDKLNGSDNIFFKNFENFITRQGLLYHIDYDLLSENYKGHIKNIDYNERTYDGSNIILTLHNAIFNGTGSFQAPKSLKTNIDKIYFQTSDTSKDVSIEINRLGTQSSDGIDKSVEVIYEKSKELYDKTKEMYEESDIPEKMNDMKDESEDTAREIYNTSMQMKSMFFKSKDKKSNEELNIEAQNVDINSSSQNDKKKSKNKSYFFFESLKLNSNTKEVKMSQLVYNSSMQNIDKKSFEKLQKLMLELKTRPSSETISKLKVSAIEILSNGLKVHIPEFSVAKVFYEGEDLGGFKLISALNIKEDKNLAAKMLFSPFFIVQNLDFKLNLSVSKKIYNKFVEEVPLALLALSATKQTATDLIYDVSYINGNLTVNGASVL